MDSVTTGFKRYKIEMKMCQPKKTTERGDWFAHDTSAIDFETLKSDQLSCGKYFDKGSTKLISGKEESTPFNQFRYDNQLFAWEQILVFQISDWSSRGWHPPMYIVLPMKYKSFRTQINLSDLSFKEGKVIVLPGNNARYEESILKFDISLKGEQGVELKSYRLKDILEPD
jgi:hypothetical protein